MFITTATTKQKINVEDAYALIADKNLTHTRTTFADINGDLVPVKSFTGDVTLTYEVGGDCLLCDNCYSAHHGVLEDHQIEDDEDYDRDEVANELDRYEVEAVSPEDPDDYESVRDDFSTQQCFACSTTLGGYRYHARYYA